MQQTSQPELKGMVVKRDKVGVFISHNENHLKIKADTWEDSILQQVELSEEVKDWVVE